MKFLVRVLVFCWYLIHFNSKFSPWTIVSKGKIWPRWWSKIQLDQIVRSKGQFFYHTQLGILVLIAIKGVLNVMTLWSTIRSCCIYLLPFFGFEICNSHFFFFFLGFWHVFWLMNLGQTKYSIDTNDHEIKQIFFNFIPLMVLIYCCMVRWHDLMLGCRD